MLKVYNDGRRMTAALSGDIDHHSARALRAELDEQISFSRPEQLILDFAEVGFMDSSGIGLILGRLKAVRAIGGDILIKNARSDIEAVIRLSGLGGLLVKGVKS
ncbi:MAG: anti-sigma factor antagonist [Oscillospiraceae bacterium]